MTKIIDKKIQSIIQQCESLSIDDIEKLSNYKKLKTISSIKSRRCCDIYLILAIIFGLLSLFTTGISHTGIEYFLEYSYRKLFSIDIYREECLAPKLESIIDIFRPPISCDICHNLNHIERISNITREEFEEKYAYTNRPVIITDAMNNWLATEEFNFKFFKRLYRMNSSALLAVEENCQFFPYRNKDEFETLGDVFDMDLERAYMINDNYRPWYVGWSNCDYSTAYLLRQYYTKPYFLPKQSESSKLDWIFMGTPGFGAHMHIDNVDLPSWQAQVRGRKQWTLRPVPECFFQCKELKFIVEPGEIIVLNTNVWYHKTFVISEDEISITIGSEFD
ncbi:unnamed protein product [Rotaria sordida]|uniref:Cupin-like domain-containing protein n=1 Tax=Rotaria sordida TaxID=392033 RepID=A0A819A0E9_9BILA|nr:unnamed protein product [Rotaria sordida]CAF3770651.1 unnamed protein product [Rotaria sordida]